MSASVHRSRRDLLIGATTAAAAVLLPGCAPGPVNRFLRRKNLTVDFSPVEQRALADLVFGYLTDDLVLGHMDQVDHLDNLFSDHRMYLYEIEKALIRDGHLTYVPLPIWEPLNDIPAGWERVHSPFHHMRLAPFNLVPRAGRPRVPDRLKPDRIAANPMATAHELAEAIGRSAASAPGSYHFNSHFALGGPFVSMTSAASALMFWAFHPLLVDVYDTWLATKFPGTSRRTVVGRAGDGRLELFTVTSDHRLWRAWQRRTTNHYNDLDRFQGAVTVAFDHWSHWFQMDEGREIADVRVVTDEAGRLTAIAQINAGGGASSPQLAIRRQTNADWTAWTVVDSGAAEIRDFGASLNPDGTLEIIAIRAGSGGYAVSAKTETAPQRSVFGGWSDITAPDQFSALSIGTYRREGRRFPHLALSIPGRLVHAWKDGSGWRHRPFSDEPFASVQLADNADGTPVMIAINQSDGFVYDTAMIDALADIGAGESWRAWQRVGSGTVAFRALAAAPHQDGRVHTFGTDSSGRVHRAHQATSGGGWSNWEEIPLLPIMGRADEPIAARDYTGRLKLFVRAADNFTYVADEIGLSQWIGWTNI